MGIQIDFEKPNYFENYKQFRTEFIVSTCATITRNPKAMAEARKCFETNKQDIAKSITVYPNRLLEYKEILNPTLWKDFEIVTAIFTFVEYMRFGKTVNPMFLNIASYCNPELNNLRKNNYKGDFGRVFEMQSNRVVKLMGTLLNNQRKTYELHKEIDILVLVMTVIREYVGTAQSYATNLEVFSILSHAIYRQATFYNNALEFKRTKEDFKKNIFENYMPEIKAVMDILNLNGLHGEIKYSHVEANYSLKIIGYHDIIDKLEGTRLYDILEFDEVDFKEVRELKKNIFGEMYEGSITDISNIIEMIVGASHSTNISIVTEIDDISLTKEEIMHCIGMAILKATMFKTNFYEMIINITNSIKNSALIKAYDEELKKQTAVEIVTVETENEKTTEELQKAKQRITELSIELENLDLIKSKNEELELEAKRLREELNKKSNNDKELKALRDLAYANSNNFFEETVNEDSLTEAVKYLKSQKVILIGGAHKWAQKLKNVLPDLQHYDADSQNRNLDSKLKNTKAIVIYNTELNSHGVSYHVMPVIEKNPDIELVMVNSHYNINRLIKYVYSTLNVKL